MANSPIVLIHGSSRFPHPARHGLTSSWGAKNAAGELRRPCAPVSNSASDACPSLLASTRRTTTRGPRRTRSASETDPSVQTARSNARTVRCPDHARSSATAAKPTDDDQTARAPRSLFRDH